MTPNIFTAVQERLALKLQRDKKKIILVIITSNANGELRRTRFDSFLAQPTYQPSLPFRQSTGSHITSSPPPFASPNVSSELQKLPFWLLLTSFGASEVRPRL